jgi:hypothetical protein
VVIIVKRTVKELDKLFQELRQIRYNISVIDNDRIFSQYFEPGNGASQEKIAKAELAIDRKFPLAYRDFLQICNGWKNFFFNLDLLSTDDFVSGTYNEFIEGLISVYEPIMDNLMSSPDWFDIRDCIIFGVNRVQGDLFLFNLIEKNRGEFETVWWYNGVVERRDKFDGFLRMILELQERNYQDLQSTATEKPA